MACPPPRTNCSEISSFYHLHFDMRHYWQLLSNLTCGSLALRLLEGILRSTSNKICNICHTDLYTMIYSQNLQHRVAANRVWIKLFICKRRASCLVDSLHFTKGIYQPSRCNLPNLLYWCLVSMTQPMLNLSLFFCQRQCLFFLMLNNLFFDTGNENSMFAICLIVV